MAALQRDQGSETEPGGCMEPCPTSFLSGRGDRPAVPAPLVAEPRLERTFTAFILPKKTPYFERLEFRETEFPFLRIRTHYCSRKP